MATNENQVGVVATFDIQQFVQNQKVYVQLIQKTNDETSKQVKAQQKAAQAQQEALKNLKEDFIKGSVAIAGAIGAIVIAFKQAEQGARTIQLQESFTRLIGTEAEAAAMMRQLADATRGTMTEEQLMAPILQALTGSEGVFADKLKESAPMLYEMAAASAKLNPLLGSTATVLEGMAASLETGNTRGLKRYGIIIDSTKAQEDYAKSIGLTKDQLTEEEQKTANLIAALEYHNTLMAQVGGTVESAVDPFLRLGAAIDEVIDDMRKKLAPAAAIAADAIANLLMAGKNFTNQEQDILAASRSYEDYTRAVQEAAAAQGLTITTGDRVSQLRGQGINAQKILTQQEYELAKAGQESLTIENIRVNAYKALSQAQDVNTRVQEAQIKKLDDYHKKLQDVQIKTGESLLTAEKDYQDKSAKAWTDYIEKSNSIIADGIKARAKIEQSYNDSIVKAQSDYLRGLEDLNYNHGNKLADIERGYQDRIREIQTTYQEDAQDAVRNLDAIALLRAREKRDKDLTAARQSHDEEVRAEQEAYQRSLYELQRALQDKRDEAERDRRRALDEQRQNEQEAQDDAKQAYRDQLTDAQNAFAEKQATIRAQYAQEDAAAQAHYLSQEAALTNHLAAMQAIMARYGMLGGESVNPVRVGGGYRRAQGGIDIVNSPSQFTVGEAGPELMITAPLNRAIPTPATQIVNHVGDFSHSINAAIESSVSGMDGRITAAVRKALQEVIGQ